MDELEQKNPNSFELNGYKPNFEVCYDGTTFHVHKDLIGLHCKTLNVMISEKSITENSIHIPAVQVCSSSDFKDFLAQIYPHEISLLNKDNITGISGMAHWADAKYVRDDCSKFLLEHCESIHVEQLLILYEIFQYKLLEEKILQIVLNRCLDDDFQDYAKLNPSLKDKLFVMSLVRFAPPYNAISRYHRKDESKKRKQC